MVYGPLMPLRDYCKTALIALLVTLYSAAKFPVATRQCMQVYKTSDCQKAKIMAHSNYSKLIMVCTHWRKWYIIIIILQENCNK